MCFDVKRRAVMACLMGNITAHISGDQLVIRGGGWGGWGGQEVALKLKQFRTVIESFPVTSAPIFSSDGIEMR